MRKRLVPGIERQSRNDGVGAAFDGGKMEQIQDRGAEQHGDRVCL